MPTGIGLSFEGNLAPAVLLEIAKAADQAGVGTLWAASHLFQREPIASAAMVLANTAKLRAALMAMSPYTVHPVYTAMAAATLDEWFPGRVTVCFGTGSPRDLASVGMEAAKPLRAISESMALTRALFSGESVQFRGQRFQVDGRRLSAGRRDIPIVLAASGPRMLELAGAEADGVLISAATSPEFVAWALGHVAAGEARTGRRVHRAALVYAAAAADRDALRRNLAFILRGAHHAHNLALAGTKLDQAALADAFAREDWPAVGRLVDDTVLDNHTASGTPARVRVALARYEGAGLDEIVLSGVASGGALERLLIP